MIGVKVKGVNKAVKKIRELEKNLSNNRSYLQSAGKIINEFHRNRFDNETGWKKTEAMSLIFRKSTPSGLTTLDEFKANRGKTLVDTGQLREAVFNPQRTITNDLLQLTVVHPYADALQEGLQGGKITERRLRAVLRNKIGKGAKKGFISAVKEFARKTPSEMPPREIMGLPEYKIDELFKIYKDKVDRDIKKFYD